MSHGDQVKFISAKTLIKCMVKVDPAARITAKEIRDHHWVKVCDSIFVSAAQFYKGGHWTLSLLQCAIQLN